MIAARLLARCSLKPASLQRPASLRRAFAWWPFSKKQSSTTSEQPDSDKDPKDMENLVFLVEAIKKQNQLQRRLV